ncbi:MAG: helix-turn-helix domain-containing protein, partial [Planococcus donghaensis]
MNMNKELHAQLKALREERNLSLDELALKTRIGIARLQAFESGEEVPSTQNIMILSNA